ncbi:MAG TPA: hypothetical protein VGK38_13705, partial [Prolixibacteraceae bacterium]
YSGALTKTLNISSAALALTTNQYRVLLTSTDGVTTSNGALLTVNPLVFAGSVIISGPASFIPGSSGVEYIADPVTNAASYIWAYSGTGVTITGTDNSAILDFSIDATPGDLTVIGHNVCGDGAVSSLSLTTSPKVLNIKVFLEGAYNTGTSLMNTTLNTNSLIPLSQPYDVAPWSYGGTESVTAIPADVVDWVLVELRDAATPESALNALPGWPKAYLLKSNGDIVDLDGTSLPSIGNPLVSNSLFVVIRHRNHIDIMSAGGMTSTVSSYGYNFTDNIAKAFGGSAGYREIEPGVFGMVSGDTDSDGDITVLDFSTWATDFGKTSIYLHADIDEDGEVSVLDFSKWATNFGVINMVPFAPLKSMNINGSRSTYKSQVPGAK